MLAGLCSFWRLLEALKENLFLDFLFASGVPAFPGIPERVNMSLLSLSLQSLTLLSSAGGDMYGNK